jgi:hypothetical protein
LRKLDNDTIGMRQFSCVGDWFVEPPVFEEDCSEISWYITASAGHLVTLPGGVQILQGLPEGTHTVRYIASDACGFYNTKEILVTVVDDVLPIAVCDLNTESPSVATDSEVYM